MHLIKFLSGESIVSERNETLLEAAIRAGTNISNSCLAGRCGQCKMRIQSGETETIRDEDFLIDAEKSNGWILSCCRIPASDLVIGEIENINLTNLYVTKQFPVKINLIEKLNNKVVKIILRTPKNIEFNYLEGQYIDIIYNGTKRSYSIANRNDNENIIEIHVKHYPNGILSNYFYHHAKQDDLLWVIGPKGNFYLRQKPIKNLIFLATGTGYAPIQAILQKLEQSINFIRPERVSLYWGVRSEDDIYLEVPKYSYELDIHYVFSRNKDKSKNNYYIQHEVLRDKHDFLNSGVYACGRLDMIKDAKKIFMQYNLPENHFWSDVFLDGSLT